MKPLADRDTYYPIDSPKQADRRRRALNVGYALGRKVEKGEMTAKDAIAQVVEATGMEEAQAADAVRRGREMHIAETGVPGVNV